LLFIHRDAETKALTERKREIELALQEVNPQQLPIHVCVVPVRMTEAWLLFDESAIRWAAGNRHGQNPLDLPRFAEIESLADPKSLLYELLRTASGLRGRRLRRFPVSFHASRVAGFIHDFSPLRNLPAFADLENSMRAIVRSTDWTN
jgi:hypothetical protein